MASRLTYGGAKEADLRTANRTAALAVWVLIKRNNTWTARVKSTNLEYHIHNRVFRTEIQILYEMPHVYAKITSGALL